MNTGYTKKFVFIAALSLFPIYTGHAESKAKWETIRQEKGITVQKREVEGSSLVQFRGMGTVNATVLEILALIYDTDKHPQWVLQLWLLAIFIFQ